MNLVVPRVTSDEKEKKTVLKLNISPSKIWFQTHNSLSNLMYDQHDFQYFTDEAHCHKRTKYIKINFAVY